MAYLEQAQLTGALDDGPHAVPVDLDRDGVGHIGNQQRPRGARTHLHHLSHKPIGIDQWLAHEHPVPLTPVEYQLQPLRVGGHPDQFRHQYIAAHQRAGIQQCPQANILRLQGRHLL